jgi:hypothetical protein
MRGLEAFAGVGTDFPEWRWRSPGTSGIYEPPAVMRAQSCFAVETSSRRRVAGIRWNVPDRTGALDERLCIRFVDNAALLR